MKKKISRSFLLLIFYAFLYVYILARFLTNLLVLNIITGLFWIYICYNFHRLNPVRSKKILKLLILPSLISLTGFMTLGISPAIWNLSDWILLPFSEITRSLVRLLGFKNVSSHIIILLDLVFMLIIADLVYLQLDGKNTAKDTYD